MDPIPRTRPVDAVVTRLRDAVLSGAFAAGANLPPERELAETLGVSRLTLRAAIATLEAEGLLRARQGDGVRVLDLGRHGTLELLPHLADARPGLFADVLALRRAVAVEAVAAACRRATDADLERLAGLVGALAAETDDRAWDARDLEFTRAVLEVADNLAFLLLLNSVEGVYRAHPALAAALRADRALALAGHAAVLALLRARDPDAARAALLPALEALDAAALARLGAP